MGKDKKIGCLICYIVRAVVDAGLSRLPQQKKCFGGDGSPRILVCSDNVETQYIVSRI